MGYPTKYITPFRGVFSYRIMGRYRERLHQISYKDIIYATHIKRE